MPYMDNEQALIEQEISALNPVQLPHMYAMLDRLEGQDLINSTHKVKERFHLTDHQIWAVFKKWEAGA